MVWDGLVVEETDTLGDGEFMGERVRAREVEGEPDTEGDRALLLLGVVEEVGRAGEGVER